MSMGWDIVDEIAVLYEAKNGWKKEVNLIKWDNREPKYDVRWWPPNRPLKGKRERANVGKGFTFTKEEFFSLGDVIAFLKK